MVSYQKRSFIFFSIIVCYQWKKKRGTGQSRIYAYYFKRCLLIQMHSPHSSWHQLTHTKSHTLINFINLSKGRLAVALFTGKWSSLNMAVSRLRDLYSRQKGGWMLNYAQDGNVAVSDYDNKWISIHEPGGKFLSKIGSNKVKKLNKKENFLCHIVYSFIVLNATYLCLVFGT